MKSLYIFTNHYPYSFQENFLEDEILYLSKYFKVPKTSIVVLRGETSKEKTILLKTADEAKLEIIKQTFQAN